MSSARGIRTRTSCGLSAVTPASWSRAPRERIPGIGPGTSPRQGDALPLRHIRVEPARRIELRLPPYQGGVLPLPLGRHELAALESDQDFRGQSAVGCRYPIGHRAFPRCRPGRASHTKGDRAPARKALPPVPGLEPWVSAEDANRPCVAGGPYARADSNRHYRRPQRRASCRWATSACEPLARLERATSSVRRKRSGQVS